MKKKEQHNENEQDLFEVISSSIAEKVIQKFNEVKQLEETQKAKDPEDIFLNTKEACKFIQVVPVTLKKYVKAGLIPKRVKGERGNIYKKSDLIKFLENGIK